MDWVYIKDALRFYGGDVRKRTPLGELTVSDIQNDGLFDDEKIYRTLNSLFFPGLVNERERIETEGKMLNPAVVLRIKDVFEIVRKIYASMNNEEWHYKSVICSRRIERGSTLKYLKQGFLPSFYSTSRGNYQTDYSDKAELVLLEFALGQEVPYVDFSKALEKEYLKVKEQEILLPPFLPVELEELKLGKSDLNIRDMYGNPPVGKYRVYAKKYLCHERLAKEEVAEKWSWLTDERRLEDMAAIVKQLNQKQVLRENEERDYMEWKCVFQELCRKTVFC